MKHRIWILVFVALALTLTVTASRAQSPLGTAFTYQGQLKNAAGPVTDTCNFQFSLWDAASGGTQIGATQTQSGVSVTDGLFTVQLDFGAAAFQGEARWLAIAVQCSGDSAYTDLTPRQALTAAPYASYALSAPWSGLSGVPSGFADGVDNDTTYTAGDGLELAGTQFRMKGTSYQNVVIVAKSGGDFTSIQAALDSITDASDANRYLIWVAPGVYTGRVTMKPYVDIEGAGELTTKITYTGSASEQTGTVVGANNAELRFLTVENTGGNWYATAIYNSSASPRLTHITASASGGNSNNCGVYNHTNASPTMTNITASASGGSNSYGVLNYSSSSPTMTNVTASASGGTYTYGVYNHTNSSPTMTNVTASALGGTHNHGVRNFANSSPTMTNVTVSASGGTDSYGVVNNSSSLVINNSLISASGGTNNHGIANYASGGTYTVLVNNSKVCGSTNTIRNDAQFTTRVGASLLDGGNVYDPTGSSLTCAGVYDENYTFYANTCP